MEGAPILAFKIVYVDDGGSDSTLDALRELQRTEPRVRILALPRRFGQEVAIAAGVEHADGDVLAIIDAGLQDPPELPRHAGALAWRRGRGPWRADLSRGRDSLQTLDVARFPPPRNLCTRTWFPGLGYAP